MRATSAFILECGISTVSCLAIPALRMRVKKSAMGSLTLIFPYQLAFVTPGIFPSCASSLKQILHKPNFRKYPRALPHRWHRLYSRTSNFCGFCCLTNSAFLGISKCSLARPERHPQEPQELPGFLVGLGGGHDRDVQATRGVNRVVGDLREDELLPE